MTDRKFNGTGVGTTAGVSVTTSAVTGRQHYITGIQCSGDAAALVTIESPADTVKWRKRFAAAFNHSERFETPVVGAITQAVITKISASTSNCEANHQGYSGRDSIV
jgi:hypothetical protein